TDDSDSDHEKLQNSRGRLAQVKLRRTGPYNKSCAPRAKGPPKAEDESAAEGRGRKGHRRPTAHAQQLRILVGLTSPKGYSNARSGMDWLNEYTLWLKALHIFFMVCWFAGIFYLPRLFVNHAMTEEAAVAAQLGLMERKLYRFITPFAVLTVLFGLALM